MSEPKHVGDLEIDQDLAFQRRSWVVQRVGWILMLLLLACAVAGLVGPGPLSSAEAGVRGSPLWIEYNRFERYESPTTLRVHIGPGVGADGRVRVGLNREFVDGVDFVRVVPEPEAVEAGPGGLVMTVRVAAGPADVVVSFEPRRYGSLPIRVSVADGFAVEATAFIYP
jgi:hypothetical protein